jgi:hypothetical protein
MTEYPLFRCTRCETTTAQLSPGLDPRYASAHCPAKGCKRFKKSLWVRVEGLRPPEPPPPTPTPPPPARPPAYVPEGDAKAADNHRRRVAQYLVDRLGEWVEGPELLQSSVGGSEGLRRMRELRNDLGWHIEGPRRIPGRTARVYRLATAPSSMDVTLGGER